MKKDFEHFMDTLTPSISGYDTLVDTNKVLGNYKKIPDDWADLNKLIQDYDTFYNNIESFLDKNKDFKEYIPLLFATRNDQKRFFDPEEQKDIKFNENTDSHKIKEILKKSPLDEMIEEHLIHDVRDYVIGVEVGLDSNGRKNRTGQIMEHKVASLLEDKGLTVLQQYNSFKLNVEHNVDINQIKKFFPNSSANKVFDFKFIYKNEIYLGETNFYSAGGSKLNEVCKSYMYLDKRVNDVKGLHFFWVTDGCGWNSAKNQISEAYNDIQYVFNLNDLKNHTLEELFSK